MCAYSNYIPAQAQSNSIGVAETDIFAVSGQLFNGLPPNNTSFFDNFNVTAVSVPEPTTVVLSLAGLGLLGAGVWHRRRANKLAGEQLVTVGNE